MTGDPDPVTVIGQDDTEHGSYPIELWCEVARQTLREEGIDFGALDLIAVDESKMQELNRTHMGVDGPTDVLAFPLDGPDTSPRAEPGDLPLHLDPPLHLDLPLHLGDVVLCPLVAQRQAPEHCGTFDAEMTLLVVHGVLHVLGHDHAEPDETLIMQARERHHLARHGHRHPVSA